MLLRLRDILLILVASSKTARVVLKVWASPRVHSYARNIIGYSDLDTSYDYIIAGGGLAGLVLASRLSEDSSVSVLVLEAGQSGDAVASQIDTPADAYYSSIVGTDYDWQHQTVPQVNLNNQVITWPRGKVLGGSSAMNAMYLVRPSTTEVDALAAIIAPEGNNSSSANWGWNSMYQFMKRSENFTQPATELQSYMNISYDASTHGSGGPMQISYPAFMINIVNNWTSVLELTGVPNLPNPNGGITLGGFIAPSSINPFNWTRSYSRSSYIDPLPPRSNLHILPQATVLRLSFGSHTDLYGNHYANGIEFAQDSGSPTVTAKVKREVILAGGALGSPKILMLSGVGPKDVLENASIPLTVELAGVGQHLQDHLTAAVVWQTPYETAGTIQATNSDFSKTAEFLSFINDAVAYVNMTNLFYGPVPDFQTQLLSALNQSSQTLVPSQYPEVIEGYKAIYETLANNFFADVAQVELLLSVISPGTVAIQAALQHPFSQGRAYIASSNPFDPIAIDPQYYSHFADITIMRQGIKFVRLVSAAFGATLGVELAPGSNVQADSDIESWLSQGGASTQYHPIGTCAMLPNSQGGVVNANLNVYGLANVRVADASVFPFEFAAHLGSMTYGLAEQAASLIKEKSYTVPDKAVRFGTGLIPSFLLGIFMAIYLTMPGVF